MAYVGSLRVVGPRDIFHSGRPLSGATCPWPSSGFFHSGRPAAARPGRPLASHGRPAGGRGGQREVPTP
eukprot:10100679-Lingulodinium_polyedra.AAC.1